MLAELDTRSDEDYAAPGGVLPATGEGGDTSNAFACSRASFEALVGKLGGVASGALEHAELEAMIDRDGRELLRLLLQDHLDLRAARETRLDGVTDADGIDRRSAERNHDRVLATVFGEVTVRRIAYRSRGARNLCPADADLNLPRERHSHGLRRLAAIEASRGSYDEAAAAITRATGVRPAKRQLEQLALRAATDFAGFQAARERAPAEPGDVLVLSCDGKGVVMRPDALRAPTRTRAACATTKLKTRLSKGEKRNRKRIAEVGAVYDIEPAARTPADVMPAGDDERAQAKEGPRATHKWLTASVVADAATVVADIFDEADRRDPDHARDWVALVDGNNHQIQRIRAEAAARDKPVAIVCDFVHVLEYLWKAAWSFHAEADPAAEQWVRHHARNVLDGKATRVAGAIRRQATTSALTPKQREGADICARYLTNKAAYLDYPTALTHGWPIATGVIEGACRHLVKDRMDLTGARWGLDGAEAILKLRALRSNDNFDEYWTYHLAQERRRVHESRYTDGVIPTA
ncbi:hypothetical protein BH20ACT16_BH20ACT16_05120 [soil metagenome]